MNKFLLLMFTLCIFHQHVYADETCSRVATINYQEVLVDAGSNKRGEGLRYYLEKDPISESLLNEYQLQNKPSEWNASASTLGSLMILAGIVQSDENTLIGDKTSLLLGGAVLVTLSYLTSKTVQAKNEILLKQAVDQYNKRNNPRIYFSPFRDNNGGSGLGVGLQQGF